MDHTDKDLQVWQERTKLREMCPVFVKACLELNGMVPRSTPLPTTKQDPAPPAMPPPAMAPPSNKKKSLPQPTTNSHLPSIHVFISGNALFIVLVTLNDSSTYPLIIDKSRVFYLDLRCLVEHKKFLAVTDACRTSPAADLILQRQVRQQAREDYCSILRAIIKASGVDLAQCSAASIAGYKQATGVPENHLAAAQAYARQTGHLSPESVVLLQPHWIPAALPGSLGFYIHHISTYNADGTPDRSNDVLHVVDLVTSVFVAMAHARCTHYRIGVWPMLAPSDSDNELARACRWVLPMTDFGQFFIDGASEVEPSGQERQIYYALSKHICKKPLLPAAHLQNLDAMNLFSRRFIVSLIINIMYGLMDEYTELADLIADGIEMAYKTELKRQKQAAEFSPGKRNASSAELEEPDFKRRKTDNNSATQITVIVSLDVPTSGEIIDTDSAATSSATSPSPAAASAITATNAATTSSAITATNAATTAYSNTEWEENDDDFGADYNPADADFS